MKFRALIAAASVLFSAAALAQAPAAGTFPSKTVRLVIPFPPGGSNDIIGRFLATRLGERLGVPVVVENKAGADGLIGTQQVVQAEPDGHTLVIVSTSYTQNPAIHKMPFDPLKALTPVALLASGGNVVAVHPSSKLGSIRDLIAQEKSRPGSLRYASSGLGGFNHFGGELFNVMAGTKLEHIPYKGGGPAMVDVMGGQVEVLFSTLVQALPHIRTGKLKALGVGSPARSPQMPDVPTISEAGVPGYDASVWWGILTRTGAPAAAVTRLNTEINAILREPDFIRRLENEAATPTPETPEAFARLIEVEMQKWARIAREANIRGN